MQAPHSLQKCCWPDWNCQVQNELNTLNQLAPINTCQQLFFKMIHFFRLWCHFWQVFQSFMKWSGLTVIETFLDLKALQCSMLTSIMPPYYYYWSLLSALEQTHCAQSNLWHHDPTIFWSLAVKNEPTWLHTEEIRFKAIKWVHPSDECQKNSLQMEVFPHFWHFQAYLLHQIGSPLIQQLCQIAWSWWDII